MIQILTGKRKKVGIDSDEDTSYQKLQAYDDSTSSDEDSRSSSRHGKEPAGGRYYTKKGKLQRRPIEPKGVMIASINLYINVIIGYKRQRSEDGNSDGQKTQKLLKRI